MIGLWCFNDYSVTAVPYGRLWASLDVPADSYLIQTLANTTHKPKFKQATTATSIMTEAPNEANANVHTMKDLKVFFWDHFHDGMDRHGLHTSNF